MARRRQVIHYDPILEDHRNILKGDVLRVDAASVVCDRNVIDDLWHLIPTWFRWHDLPLYLYCDEYAERVAQELCAQIGKSHLLETQVVDLEKGVNLPNIGIQDSYWKPIPIWWKLEGLRQTVEKTGGGVLCIDADICFLGSVVEEWFEADCVMSPFYWGDPYQRVPKSPEDPTPVPIPERDGWFNAGYFLTHRVEVAEKWMELYESGVDGFYEQACMARLQKHFHCSFFNETHNWGIWRKEGPRINTRSLHVHAGTSHKPNLIHHKAIELRARQAAARALEYHEKNICTSTTG